MCVARKSHWAHPVSLRQPIGETFTIWLTFVGDSIVLGIKNIWRGVPQNWCPNFRDLLEPEGDQSTDLYLVVSLRSFS